MCVYVYIYVYVFELDMNYILYIYIMYELYIKHPCTVWGWLTHPEFHSQML